ncbi:MAG: enoyl-CoA hydratase/carnithine racemase, partial [Candidatus Azotimanducaceae bacterium]
MSERFQDRVIFERVDRVAIISLDRPERLNAFDTAMYKGV